MQKRSRTRIKICCIGNLEEAVTAIDMGASALGLVGKMPSGPGSIPDHQIKKIVERIPPAVSTFLLTSETTIGKVVAHQKKVNTTTIQLVDMLKAGKYKSIRNKLPTVKIVQVIHVTGEESIEKAIEVSTHVDAILLDSGNPDLKVKELGGTGKVHDWKISRKIVDSVIVPVFLAGGLHSGNVQQALNIVQPFGVDVCNGVRTNGKLDRRRLEAFFEAVERT